LRVQTHPKYDFSVGDTVHVAVDVAQISVFPRMRASASGPSTVK
jgi:hypothetical protein